MLKTISTIAFAMFISFTMLTSFVYADPPEGTGKKEKVKAEKHEKGKKNDHKGNESGGTTFVDVRFEDIRRIAIDNHYTGYKSLPPGIRKNLARGKPLPPGIAKKVVPGPMLRELPRYSGYEWRVCGNDLVLVSIATEIIEQIIGGVFQ
jgi:Ni/Co efflux regulator RcnB